MASWTITEPRRLDIDDAVKRLDVDLVGGRLTVVGTDGPAQVQVNSVTVDTPLEVSTTGDRLSVRHPNPSTWPGLLRPVWWWLVGNRRWHSDVSVAVPFDTPALLRISSGTAVVSGVHADLTVECVSGRITLLGNAGRIRAHVVSGPIEALGCAGDISLETVSGEITLADSATERLHAKTVSGAITADLDNPPGNSDIRLETISGEITIQIRADSNLAVELTAAHGRVTSSFPGLSGAGSWGSSVRGVLGTGAGRLSASAVGGNIALLCRPVDADFDRTDDAEVDRDAGEPR